MSKTISINPAEHKTKEVHQHLLSAIAPRPIAWASTIDKEGRTNLAPFSFFNVFGSNPATLIFSPARRVRDNTTKHTLENILEIPEVVVNIANYALVREMRTSSLEFAQGVSEFDEAGLTAVPSEVVKPPRVGEAPVSFECTVNQVIATGENGGAGNLIICTVQRIHLKEDILDEDGKISIEKLDPIGRMGGVHYCRVIPASIFQFDKSGNPT